jgi:hypothetical protein
LNFSINGKTVERVYQDVDYIDIWFTDGTILKITGRLETKELDVVVLDQDGSYYNCSRVTTTFYADVK